MNDHEARDELIRLIGSVIPREHTYYGTEGYAADAILAAGYRKHPEPEWEYGIRAEGDTEPWSDHSDDLDWLLDNASGNMGMSDYAVQRTKAGPWEPVS